VDDHLIAVSPAVELKPGSRIAFRGRPMANECRLVKLTAFSSSVEVPVKVQWLLHVDPRARAVVHEKSHEIAWGDAAFDVYPLLPVRSAAAWNLHSITKPAEPFTFRQTRRLILEPAFEGDSVTLLNLLHLRKAAEAGLENTGASISGNTIEAHWTRGLQRFSLTWNLEQKTVKLLPLR
jgi:hypothetical protein